MKSIGFLKNPFVALKNITKAYNGTLMQNSPSIGHRSQMLTKKEEPGAVAFVTNLKPMLFFSHTHEKHN